MKISREQVAENRERILDAAARLFRERGFEGVTVAQIMQAAGLTHGAFYGHFASKDDLIAQAFAHVLAARAGGETLPASLYDFADLYLTGFHRDHPGQGCLFATIGTEAPRTSPPARAALTASVRRQIDNFSKSAGGATEQEKRRAATGSWAAMIGAVLLARLVDDPALSDRLLEDTRLWLQQREAGPAVPQRAVNAA